MVKRGGFVPCRVSRPTKSFDSMWGVPTPARPRLTIVGGKFMKFMMNLLQGHIKAIVVIILISVVYSLARLPNLPAGERLLMASRFGFSTATLPGVSGRPQKYIRT